MNPDDTLGGHQWSGLESELDKLSIRTTTNTYYLQHGGSETISEFVVCRNSDLVIINGSERMNKVCARMRWTYLMKEGWKQTYE